MEELEKDFLPYKQALELKELGFNEPCLDYFANSNPQNSWTISYNSDDLHRPFESVARPTYSQAIRWFRNKYNLLGSIDYSNRLKWYYVIREIITSNTFHNHSTSNKEDFNTYEEAELECLKKLIEIEKLLKIDDNGMD